MHHVDLSQTGGVRDKTNADVAALRSEISRLRQLVDELQTQLASSARQLECARSNHDRAAAEATSATAESAVARQRSEEAELLRRSSCDAAGEERLRHCLKELDRLRERLRESEEGETAQRQRGQAEQEVAMELRKESER